MSSFHYVYILTSLSQPGRFYTGITRNLRNRLDAHNQGQVAHTTKHRPWRIETAVAFRSEQKAVDFEKYLKTHSGRAYARKRF